MAPRVHNSGHWTIEGAITSQFENHIRAICGLPLGSTNLVAAKIEMRNLIGDEVDDAGNILTEPSNPLHLYGQRKARRSTDRQVRKECVRTCNIRWSPYL